MYYIYIPIWGWLIHPIFQPPFLIVTSTEFEVGVRGNWYCWRKVLNIAAKGNFWNKDTCWWYNYFIHKLCVLKLLTHSSKRRRNNWFIWGVLLQNWTIHGLYWGSCLTHEPRVLIDSLNELLLWLSKGLITVQISHRYRLAEVSNIDQLSSLVRSLLLVTRVSCFFFLESKFLLIMFFLESKCSFITPINEAMLCSWSILSTI